jgi:hypothetical protein
LIGFSALLTAVAIAILVAGVIAASLGLIYLSIAVSALAAVTLAVGVLLRRREIFGEAGAAPPSAEPGWAAAEAAKARPVLARPAAGDQVTADHGGRSEDNRHDGEQQGEVAARLRKAGPGTAADTGSARWPASIAAKGVPATARRGGEHPPAPSRAARSPSRRETAAREPGPGRAAEPGRDRAGAGRDRDPPRSDRERAARGRDEAVAGQQAGAFRLPPRSERTRAPAEELGRAISGDPAGNDIWDRGGEEVTGSGGQDPVRLAWPASAGPRAMGTGAEPRWDRVVPPYVDDPAGRGRQQREPEPPPAGADEPDDDAARAGATTGSAASSGWRAWSSTPARDQDAGGAAEQAGQPAEVSAGAGHEDGGAGETADRGEPCGAAEPSPVGAVPGDAERAGHADEPAETAGSAAEAERAAVPGSTRDAADTSEGAAAGGAGDAGDSHGAVGTGTDGSTSLDDEVTVVPGVPRYHRRGCILIRFLSDGDLETTTRREAQAAGSVPCKACQPDKPASAA